jgi:hypothetical protein
MRSLMDDLLRANLQIALHEGTLYRLPAWHQRDVGFFNSDGHRLLLPTLEPVANQIVGAGAISLFPPGNWPLHHQAEYLRRLSNILE